MTRRGLNSGGLPVAVSSGDGSARPIRFSGSGLRDYSRCQASRHDPAVKVIGAGSPGKAEIRQVADRKAQLAAPLGGDRPR